MSSQENNIDALFYETRQKIIHNLKSESVNSRGDLEKQINEIMPIIEADLCTNEAEDKSTAEAEAAAKLLSSFIQEEDLNDSHIRRCLRIYENVVDLPNMVSTVEELKKYLSVNVNTTINSKWNNFCELLSYSNSATTKLMSTLFEEELSKSKDKTIVKLFLFKHFYNEIFDLKLDNEIRNNLLDVSLELAKKYNVLLLDATESKDFARKITTHYLTSITTLKEQGYEKWHCMWMFLIRVLNTYFQTSMDIANKLLRIIETAFRDSSSGPRLQAYECWKELISNASLDMNYMCSQKRMNLLLTPLRAKFSKMDAVIRVRFDVFLHLMDILKEQSTLCLNEFLNFCFQPFGKGAEEIHGSQGKIVPDLWLKSIRVLQQLLGACNDGQCCGNQAIQVTQVITDVNFGKHIEILVNSVIESSMLLKHIELEDNIKQKINNCLWTSLLSHMMSLNEEQLKNAGDHFTKAINFIFKINAPDDEFLLVTLLDFTIKRLNAGLMNNEFLLTVTKATYSCFYKTQIVHKDTLKLILALSQSIFMARDKKYARASFLHIQKTFTTEKLENNETLAMDIWSMWINILDKFRAQDVLLFLWPLINTNKFKNKYDIKNQWKRRYIKIKDIFGNAPFIKVTKDLLENKMMTDENCLEFLNTLLEGSISNFDELVVNRILELIYSMLQRKTLANDQLQGLAEYFRKILIHSESFASEIKPASAFLVLTVNCLGECIENKLHQKITPKFQSVIGLLKPESAQIVDNNLQVLIMKLRSFDGINEAKKLLLVTKKSPKKINETKTATPVKTRLSKFVKIAPKLEPKPETPEKTNLRLFGKDVETLKPLNVKGSMLKNGSPVIATKSPKTTPLKTPTSTRSKRIMNANKGLSLNDEKSSDFVAINTEVKLQVDKMSDKQKEKISRRSVIPAMYQDLSQSHSQDLFNVKNNSQTSENVIVTESNLKFEDNAQDAIVGIKSPKNEMETTSTVMEENKESAFKINDLCNEQDKKPEKISKKNGKTTDEAKDNKEIVKKVASEKPKTPKPKKVAKGVKSKIETETSKETTEPIKTAKIPVIRNNNFEVLNKSLDSKSPETNTKRLIVLSPKLKLDPPHAPTKNSASVKVAIKFDTPVKSDVIPEKTTSITKNNKISPSSKENQNLNNNTELTEAQIKAAEKVQRELKKIRMDIVGSDCFTSVNGRRRSRSLKKDEKYLNMIKTLNTDSDSTVDSDSSLLSTKDSQGKTTPTFETENLNVEEKIAEPVCSLTEEHNYHLLENNKPSDKTRKTINTLDEFVVKSNTNQKNTPAAKRRATLDFIATPATSLPESEDIIESSQSSQGSDTSNQIPVLPKLTIRRQSLGAENEKSKEDNSTNWNVSTKTEQDVNVKDVEVSGKKQKRKRGVVDDPDFLVKNNTPKKLKKAKSRKRSVSDTEPSQTSDEGTNAVPPKKQRLDIFNLSQTPENTEPKPPTEIIPETETSQNTPKTVTPNELTPTKKIVKKFTLPQRSSTRISPKKNDSEQLINMESMSVLSDKFEDYYASTIAKVSPNTPLKRTSLIIPGSPVTNDTPTRNEELLCNTINISPIGSQTRITTDELFPPSKETEEQLIINNDNITELDAILNEQKTKMDAISTAETESMQLCDETQPEKEPTPKVKFPNHRSSRLLNMLNIDSPTTSESPKGRMTMIKKGSLNITTALRGKKLLSHVFKKNVSPSTPKESLQDTELLTFSRDVPSPFALPKTSILKKIDSPCPKRKKVNFPDPCMTEEKVFIRHKEEFHDACSISSNLSEELDDETMPETEESLDVTHDFQLSKVGAFYPQYVDSTEPIYSVLTAKKKMALTTKPDILTRQLKNLNIETVGQFCALPEAEVNKLDVRFPKIKTCKKVLSVLMNFNKRKSKTRRTNLKNLISNKTINESPQKETLLQTETETLDKPALVEPIQLSPDIDLPIQKSIADAETESINDFDIQKSIANETETISDLDIQNSIANAETKSINDLAIQNSISNAETESIKDLDNEKCIADAETESIRDLADPKSIADAETESIKDISNEAVIDAQIESDSGLVNQKTIADAETESIRDIVNETVADDKTNLDCDLVNQKSIANAETESIKDLVNDKAETESVSDSINQKLISEAETETIKDMEEYYNQETPTDKTTTEMDTLFESNVTLNGNLNDDVISSDKEEDSLETRNVQENKTEDSVKELKDTCEIVKLPLQDEIRNNLLERIKDSHSGTPFINCVNALMKIKNDQYLIVAKDLLESLVRLDSSLPL